MYNWLMPLTTDSDLSVRSTLPEERPTNCRAEWPVSDELPAVSTARFFGIATAGNGRVPTAT